MVVGHESAPGLNAQARGHVHKDRQAGPPGDGSNPGSPSTTLLIFATPAPSTSSPAALLSITLARSPDVVFPLSLALPLATSTTALSAANPTSPPSSTEATSPSSASSDTSLPISSSAISNGVMSTSKPNIGAIVGGIVGGMFLLALLAFLAVKYFRRRASLEAAHHKAPSAEFLDPNARELYRPPILAGYIRHRVASDSETLYSGKDSPAPFPSVVRFEDPAYRDSVHSDSLEHLRGGNYHAALGREQPKSFLVV